MRIRFCGPHGGLICVQDHSLQAIQKSTVHQSKYRIHIRRTIWLLPRGVNIMTDAFDEVFADKETIMIIMAHPDDTELYSGGTITRLIAAGKTIVNVKMTNGGKGTKQTDMKEEELIKRRIIEDTAAVERMGIKPEHNFRLGLGDGEVEND